MASSNSPMEHNDITDLLDVLNYKVSTPGVCFGLAHLAIIAMLKGKLGIFLKQLKLILDTYNEIFNAVTKETFEQFNAKNSKIKINKDDLSDKQGEKFRLFEQRFSENFIKKFYPAVESKGVPKAKKLLERLVKLQNYQTTELFKRFIPSSIASCDVISGYFNKNELIDFIDKIKNDKLNSTHPVAFEIGNINHSVAIIHDKNQWLMVDANQLPVVKCQSSTELAESIFTAFNSENQIAIRAMPYCLKADKDNINMKLSVIQDDLVANADPDKFKMLDDNGVSWLMYAISQDRINLIDILLARGADPNVKDEFGVTALDFAVEYTNLEAAKLLIQAGADVNHTAPNVQVDPALHVAVFKNKAPMCMLLAENGADILLKNTKGQSPLELALEKDSTSILSQALLQGNAKFLLKQLKHYIETNNWEVSIGAKEIELEDGSKRKVPSGVKEQHDEIRKAEAVEQKDKSDYRNFIYSKTLLEVRTISDKSKNAWFTFFRSSETDTYYKTTLAELLDSKAKIEKK